MTGIARRAPALPLAVLALFAGAGLSAGDIGSLSWYALGTQDGLAGSTVTAILQDRRGLMWFAAEGGLSCFDGKTFSTFRPEAGTSPFSSSRISCMTADPEGGIYLGCEGVPLVRLDTASGRFEAARDSSGSGPGLIGAKALAADRRGRVFASGPGGGIRVQEAKGKGFTHFADVGAEVSCLLADSGGRLWVGSRGRGLFNFDTDGRSLANYRRTRAGGGSLGDDGVSCLFEDSVGGLWIGLENGGVDVLGEGGLRHARAAAGSSLPRREVLSLAEDAEGRIWVGYAGAGMGSLDPSSLVLKPPAPGARETPLAIFRDKRGLMWVGLAAGGVRSYNSHSAVFSSYGGGAGAGQGRLRGIASIAQEASGRLVLAAADRLLTMDPEGRPGPGLSWPPVGPRPRAMSVILASRDGSLWIGTEGGGLAQVLGDGTWRIFLHRPGDETSIAGDSVSCLYEDKDASIWIGIEGRGLDRLDPSGVSFRHFEGPGPRGEGSPGIWIRGLLRDSKGRLWAASPDSGLSFLDPGSDGFLRAQGGPEGMLGDNSVSCLLEDSDSNLWVGTGGAGLARRDPETGAFVRIRAKEGQIGGSIYALTEDREGVLWILSSRGLTSYDHRVGAFFLFGAEDGLAAGSLATGAALMARNGELWIGGSDGLSSFDPRRATRYTPQPDVVITGLEQAADGQVSRPSPIAPGEPLVVLDHDNPGLVFRIAISDYVAPSRNVYAMRLEGRQAGWTSLASQNSGYIAPLAPGRYTLRVKGSNGNGVWNDYGASLAILVRPPFWSTWWFRTIAAALLAGSVALIVAARLRTLRGRNALLAGFARHVEEAREEERKIAARDVHDEIGQFLMVLNFHAFWLASHPDALEPDRGSRVKDMQGVILEAMASVKAVATRLRPGALDALDFAGALRWYARSIERISGLRLELELEEPPPNVAGEKATALFRILQEMLSNVVRHSGSATATVRLAAESGEVVLEVVDKGKGIEDPRAEAPDSFGIIGMRERCRAFGGTLVLKAHAGGGTLVRARLPIGEGRS